MDFKLLLAIALIALCLETRAQYNTGGDVRPDGSARLAPLAPYNPSQNPAFAPNTFGNQRQGTPPRQGQGDSLYGSSHTPDSRSGDSGRGYNPNNNGPDGNHPQRPNQQHGRNHQGDSLYGSSHTPNSNIGADANHPHGQNYPNYPGNTGTNYGASNQNVPGSTNYSGGSGSANQHYRPGQTNPTGSHNTDGAYAQGQERNYYPQNPLPRDRDADRSILFPAQPNRPDQNINQYGYGGQDSHNSGTPYNPQNTRYNQQQHPY